MARSGDEWEAWAGQKFGNAPSLAGFGATLAALEQGCFNFTDADAALACECQVAVVAVSPHADIAPHLHAILQRAAARKMPAEQVIPAVHSLVPADVKPALAPVLDKYWWDDQVKSAREFALLHAGSCNGIKFPRQPDGRLFPDWGRYRAISPEQAQALGTQPRPEILNYPQFISMLIEDARVFNDGVAPLVWCISEGRYYLWAPATWWAPVDEDIMKATIAFKWKEMNKGVEPADKQVNSILKMYRIRHGVRGDLDPRTKLPRPFFDIQEWTHKVPVENGVIELDPDWRVAHVRPRSARDFAVGYLKVQYDPQADCPRINAFLEQILDHHDGDTQFWIDSLLGFLSDVLIPGNTMEWILWLFGEGGNGKGVLAHLLETFFGALVCHVGWDGFDYKENRFALHSILGHYLNICSENRPEGSKAGNLENIKKVSGNDTLMVEGKHMPALEIYPPAKLMFLSNKVPNIPPTETALWRRVIAIALLNLFVGDVEDHTLKRANSPLTTPQELSGFLNLLLSYVPRRDEIKRTYMAKVDPRDIYDEYREGDSLIYSFFKEGLTHVDADEQFIYIKEMVILFRAWFILKKNVLPGITRGQSPSKRIKKVAEAWVKDAFQQKHKPVARRMGPGYALSNLQWAPAFLAELRADIARIYLAGTQWFADTWEALLLIPPNIRDVASDSEDPYAKQWVANLPRKTGLELYWDRHKSKEPHKLCHLRSRLLPRVEVIRPLDLECQLSNIATIGEVRHGLEQIWQGEDFSDDDLHGMFEHRFRDIPRGEFQAALDLLRLRYGQPQCAPPKAIACAACGESISCRTWAVMQFLATRRGQAVLAPASLPAPAEVPATPMQLALEILRQMEQVAGPDPVLIDDVKARVARECNFSAEDAEEVLLKLIEDNHVGVSADKVAHAHDDEEVSGASIGQPEYNCLHYYKCRKCGRIMEVDSSG